MLKTRTGLGVSNNIVSNGDRPAPPSLMNENSDIAVLFKGQPAPKLVNNNSDITVTFEEV